MKKLVVCLLIAMSSGAKGDANFVPLDMELGYWEITTEMNFDEMLAKVPKEQRAMMRQMMSGKMKIPVVKQCITQETYKNMQAKLMETAKTSGNDCALQVIKSSPQEFNGVVTCQDTGTKATLPTNSINPKRHEIQIQPDTAGIGQNNIKTIGVWKSATCPAGI